MRDTGPSRPSSDTGVSMHRIAGLLALALVLITAGCFGVQPGEKTTPDNATDGDGHDLDVSAETVQADAVESARSVEEYEATANTTVLTTTNNVEQETESTATIRVDRTAQELYLKETATVNGQTATAEDYVLNGTLYERNEQYVRVYNTEWIKLDISDNYSEFITEFDTLRYHGRLLENGTATLEGAESVDGHETYRLHVTAKDGDVPSYESALQGEVTITAANVTYWVDQESGDIRRMQGNVTQEVSAGGQTTVQEMTLEATLSYDVDVDVTLPPAAEDAVDPEEQSESA